MDFLEFFYSLEMTIITEVKSYQSKSNTDVLVQRRVSASQHLRQRHTRAHIEPV